MDPEFASSEVTFIMLGYLPFYHMSGMLSYLFVTLLGGGTLVTLPRFKPDLFLNAIEKYRVTRIRFIRLFMLVCMHPF